MHNWRRTISRGYYNLWIFKKPQHAHTHMFHVLPTETSDDKLFPDPRAPRPARVNNRAVQRAVHCGRDTLQHWRTDPLIPISVLLLLTLVTTEMERGLRDPAVFVLLIKLFILFWHFVCLDRNRCTFVLAVDFVMLSGMMKDYLYLYVLVYMY